MAKKKRQSKRSKSIYFEEGAIARQDGRGRTYNPYVYSTKQCSEWKRGWNIMDAGIDNILEELSQ